MDRDTAISTTAAASIQIQTALQWAEVNLPDPRWATVHGLLTKAATLAEEILDAPGTIRPDDGGGPKS